VKPSNEEAHHLQKFLIKDKKRRYTVNVTPYIFMLFGQKTKKHEVKDLSGLDLGWRKTIDLIV
jgi:hypothetical protein